MIIYRNAVELTVYGGNIVTYGHMEVQQLAVDRTDDALTAILLSNNNYVTT